MTIRDEIIEISGILRERGINLDADAVVEAARDASAYPLLHKSLEWDDAKAGENWRRQQAHQLIIRCRIRQEDGAALGLSATRPMRAFVHLRDEDGYRPTAAVISDDKMFDRLMAQVRADADRLLERLSALEAIRAGSTAPVRPHVDGLRRWIERRSPGSEPHVAAG